MPLSWEALCEIEPELESLRAEAAAIPLYTCGVFWYNGPKGIKQRLRGLVGFDARSVLLQTSDAYHTATHAIQNAIPKCVGRCTSCGAPVPPTESFVVRKPRDSGLAINASNYNAYVGSPQHGPLNSVTVVLDVLGFSNLIRSSAEEGAGNWSFKRYRDAIDYSAGYLKPDYDAWAVKVYSDNFLLGSPVSDDAELELGRLFIAVSEFQLSMAINGHFLRGGVSIGPLFMDNQLVFGKALLDAHDAEKRAVNPRVLLTREAIRCISVHCEYMKGNGAAVQSLASMPLLVDTDGEWFVDYLGSLAAYGDPPSVDSTALLAHREAVLSQAGCFAAGSTPHAKYKWVAAYHNYICKRARRPDLIVPALASDELIRPLGESDLRAAQEEFGRRFGDPGLNPRSLVMLANRPRAPR